MKKSTLIIVIVLIIILGVVVLILRSPEDDWIKNKQGVYVEHGAPAQTPPEVSSQQQTITKALELYQAKQTEGMEFSSQCLGTVEDYAVDVVHVPRSAEDNLVENQCEDFRSGKVTHFIELDKDGNVVRVV
jgi:hypothetical protein